MRRLLIFRIWNLPTEELILHDLILVLIFSADKQYSLYFLTFIIIIIIKHF